MSRSRSNAGDTAAANASSPPASSSLDLSIASTQPALARFSIYRSRVGSVDTGPPQQRHHASQGVFFFVVFDESKFGFAASTA